MIENIYKDEVLTEWRRLRDNGQAEYSDWDDFLGDWEENNGSPRKDGK